MANYHIKTLLFKLILTLGILLPARLKAQIAEQLIPDAVVIQHGGSIGYVSGGISYELFKNQRGTLDLTYGHVPTQKGGPLDILAAKFNYKAVKVKIKDIAEIYPVNPGLFVSYHTGKKFEKWPRSLYYKGYYWWSKSTRIHLSLASEAKLNGKKLLRGTGIEAVGIYSEVNTNELYAVSWYVNRDSMSFLDILRLGYGIRVYF